MMIEKSSFSELFCEIFEQNGLRRFCKEDIIDTFYGFTILFLEENAHTNLTAIKELPDVIAKHYADCLLAEHLYPAAASVLDVGCGGGFPTFPLAIARPDLKITAVDNTLKKIRFVEKTASALGLTQIKAICSRAEDPEMRKFRKQFDVATSRAMARMPILSELTLPFVKTGGKLIALKGQQGEIELNESRKAIEVLCGDRSPELIALRLCVGDQSEARTVVVAEKRFATPNAYPRPYATILKKPI